MKILSIAPICLSFFLLIGSISVAGNTDLPRFQSEKDVTPPLLPGQEQGVFEITILLKNLKDNLINNSHIIMKLRNSITGDKITNLQYIQGGISNLKLKPGRWEGTLGIDEATTLGGDFFANLNILVEKDATITPTLIPVGNIIGEIYDEKDRLVSGANIRLNCKQYLPSDVTSDEFGIFFAEYLGLGRCRVIALYNNKIGFSDALVELDKESNIRINLDKQTTGESNVALPIVIILIVIFVVFIGLSNRTSEDIEKKVKKNITEITSKKPLKENKKKRENKNKSNNSRIDDILKTLREREKEIVKFLLENNFESTQSKIIYGTGIPKTTLMRIFDNLAARNIVEVQKIGKAKKVRLTKWILGMEG
jgi:uncharacterized membrane protein